MNETCIPGRRVIEKLDEYMSRRDYAGAERHLLYWLEEARLGRDERGELVVRNELVGHYRKVGDRDKALAQGEKALAELPILTGADVPRLGFTGIFTKLARSLVGF